MLLAWSAIHRHGERHARHEMRKACCLARAESLTEEEQEALDDKQGSSPAVSDLCCTLMFITLTATRLPEASEGFA